MRILIVTDSYPPLIGGATRAAQQLSQQLVQRGHDVSVATAWQRGLPEQGDDAGVRVYRLRDLTSRVPWVSADPHRHTPPPFPDPEAVWRFRRLIRQVQPDVVYAYGWLAYSCAAALLGTKIPFLLSARDYGNICALRTLVRHGQICDGPATMKCLQCASGFYGVPKGVAAVAGVFGGRALLRWKMCGLQSCSSYVQGLMHRYLLGRCASSPDNDGIPDRVIPDFRQDTEAGVPDREILGQLPAAPYILFVGALRVIKGLEPLLAAYERLEAPPPLVLIGTRAPDTPRAFPMGVTVLHDVPHVTVMAAWERALFGVAPSILPEPFGNVLHEAMSKGKAVIGTTPGGMVDIIVAGETGLLVPAGDVEALTAAMRQMIDDAALRERMGRAGRERARLFTAEAVMPRFEALFDKIMQTHRAATDSRARIAARGGFPMDDVR